VKSTEREQYPGLRGLVPAEGALARVHPRKWEEANDPRRQNLRAVLRALPHSLSGAIGRRLRRLTHRPPAATGSL
jgi:hypothetical protein